LKKLSKKIVGIAGLDRMGRQTSGKVDLRIEFLADCPEARSRIAQMTKDEWGSRFPERQLDYWETQVFTQKTGVPFTLVGFAAGSHHPIAVVNVRDNSLEVTDRNGRYYTEAKHWVSNLVVDSAIRGQGIGKKMMEKLEGVAIGFGIQELYLFAAKSKGFYLGQEGWRVVDEAALKGVVVGAVLVKELTIKNS